MKAGHVRCNWYFNYSTIHVSSEIKDLILLPTWVRLCPIQIPLQKMSISTVSLDNLHFIFSPLLKFMFCSANNTCFLTFKDQLPVTQIIADPNRSKSEAAWRIGPLCCYGDHEYNNLSPPFPCPHPLSEFHEHMIFWLPYPFSLQCPPRLKDCPRAHCFFISHKNKPGMFKVSLLGRTVLDCCLIFYWSFLPTLSYFPYGIQCWHFLLF